MGVLTRQVSRRRSGMLLAAVLVLTLIGAAGAHGPDSLPTGHAKQPEGMTWPPQPVGMSRVRNFSDLRGATRSNIQRHAAFSRLAQRLAADPSMRGFAERPMTRLGVVKIRAANGTSDETCYEFFDRAANSTLRIIEPAQGPLRTEWVSASTYQPEIVPEEEREAVALVKQHFAERGESHAGALHGYAILAYRPEGNGFYDGRVLYVSLHASGSAPPEYAAWVDLSAQRVFNARREVAP